MWRPRPQFTERKMPRTRVEMMDARIELQCKSSPVGLACEFCERHHGAYMHQDRRANKISQFRNHQRPPDRQAVAAHKMKERAVLPLEVNRKHGSLRLLDQPCSESLPGQFFGFAGGMFRGCNPARWEHHDRYTIPQQAPRRVARFNVYLDRRSALGEIDRQSPAADFRNPQELAVGQDAKRTIELFGER